MVEQQNNNPNAQSLRSRQCFIMVPSEILSGSASPRSLSTLAMISFFSSGLRKVALSGKSTVGDGEAIGGVHRRSGRVEQRVRKKNE